MGMDMEQTEADPRMMGMLAVDMGDVKKKELVWRGQATVDSISDKQKGDEKQVLQSIKKMFKQYPPSTSSRPPAQAEWIPANLNALKEMVERREENEYHETTIDQPLASPDRLAKPSTSVANPAPR